MTQKVVIVAEVEVQVSCDAFQKNPDGSWTSIKASFITFGSHSLPLRDIKLVPGMTFRRGVPAVWLDEPLDIAQLLDERCTPAEPTPTKRGKNEVRRDRD